MKLNFVIYVTFLFVCSISYTQDFQTDLSSIRTIDNQIQKEQFNTTQEDILINRLVLESSTQNKEKGFYSKKEWRRIKKELRKNKKRVFSYKNNIYTNKTIDTIHIDIPVYNKKSDLSSW